MLPETFKTSLLGNKFRNRSDRGFWISFKFKRTRDIPKLELHPIVYKCMLSVFRPSFEVVKEGWILH